MGCPFQIFTSLPENGAPIKALSMKKPEVHTCSAEKLTPLMHKFRLKLASRMQDDLDLSWTKIWNEERQLLLEEVKDQPGLLQQVILEMGDAELFRRTAIRARFKKVPPNPKDHQGMDPDKVDIFSNIWKMAVFLVLLIHQLLASIRFILLCYHCSYVGGPWASCTRKEVGSWGQMQGHNCLGQLQVLGLDRNSSLEMEPLRCRSKPFTRCFHSWIDQPTFI